MCKHILERLLNFIFLIDGDGVPPKPPKQADDSYDFIKN
jgi:hypothetical protein